jgi:hypothetical protein
MGGSIADWPRLLKQAYEHTAPGGWVELSDFDAWASTDDDSLPVDSPYHTYQVALDEAATLFGKKMNVGPLHKERLAEAGFVDIVEVKIKVPLSPWPRDLRLKELGKYMQVQMLDAVESYGLAPLTRVLGWDSTRVQDLIVGVRQDLRNRNYHMYSNWYVSTRVKPNC